MEPRLSGLGAREVQADSCGCSDGDTQAELPGAENTPDPAWRDGSGGGCSVPVTNQKGGMGGGCWGPCDHPEGYDGG